MTIGKTDQKVYSAILIVEYETRRSHESILFDARQKRSLSEGGIEFFHCLFFKLAVMIWLENLRVLIPTSYFGI